MSARSNPQGPGRSDSWILLLVTALLIPLVFSADLIEAVNKEPDRAKWPWWLLGSVDAALLLLVLLITRIFYWKSRIALQWRMVAWWLTGAAVTLGLDLLETLTFPVWGDLLVSVGYVAALATILAATVGANPFSLISARLRRHNPEAWLRYQVAIPLLFGTLAAYVGSTLWRVLDVGTNRTERDIRFTDEEKELLNSASLTEYANYANSLCSNVVDQEYFAQVSQIIPLLLVAVGLEAKFFSRNMQEASSRAITINAVLVLLGGEVLALSALPSSGNGCDETLQGWHEYMAFVITLQAVVIALVTLALALLSGRGQGSAGRPRDPAEDPRPPAGEPPAVPERTVSTVEGRGRDAAFFGAGVLIAVGVIIRIARRLGRP
ncbi:hypothetical protein AB0K14_24795 [Actinosynnema sp. NPDC050801]|uniref:hypothetical protein n=1 Tax=unclassified Actinosynnema TaxID=2637065 RepID=UPI0033F015CB